MNISGIKPSLGFYEHTAIIFNPVVNLAEIPLAGVERASAVDSKPVAVNHSAKAYDKAGFGQYDYATRKRSSEAYGLGNRQNGLDLKKLVESAELIQEDKVLMRYQTFVTDAFNFKGNSASEATDKFSL